MISKVTYFYYCSYKYTHNCVGYLLSKECTTGLNKANRAFRLCRLVYVLSINDELTSVTQLTKVYAIVMSWLIYSTLCYFACSIYK